MEKPYTEVKYSIYDKSLYLQRLLFAIESNFRSENIDDFADNARKSLLKHAENGIDDAIDALTDVLEIIGYFPTIREVSIGGNAIWKQPTKYMKK